MRNVFIQGKSWLFWVAISVMALVSGASAVQPRVLVYTRNQVGEHLYVHDNIAASVAALQKLGAENHFDVAASENPADFTITNLEKFKVIVFDNSNNEILDTETQKAALVHFVEAGGGIVGIHSATGSMRQWPWFWAMLGGKFLRHPKLQSFTVKVKDADHPSTAHFPPTFVWTDEFYFLSNMPDDLHVLLAGDLTTLNDAEKEKSKNTFYSGSNGTETPLAWCHSFDGGRVWYTALGHQKEHYADPVFTRHLLGGILWAMGDTGVKH